MKSIARIFFGLVICFVLVECLFRMLPVNSGIRLQSTSTAVPFTRYIPNAPYTFSFGWAFLNSQKGVTNNAGFINTPDFNGTGGVLVVGDSFIEALMLPKEDTLQAKLSVMTDRKVLSAAASGNGLADTLELIRYFYPRLTPDTVVVFVKPSELSKLLAPAVRGHSGFILEKDGYSIQHKPYIESKYKEMLSHSALIRYVYYNLKFTSWVSSGLKPESDRSEGASTIVSASLLDFYFKEVGKVINISHTPVIFLIDGDRANIYSGVATDVVKSQDLNVQQFAMQARQYGFGVVSMEPYFVQHWKEYRERMDSLPEDGHWNKAGHLLAARAIFESLNSSTSK